MNTKKINKRIFGVDVDGTLTSTPPLHVGVIDLEETRYVIRNAPVKKGVDVLSRLNIKPVIITN